MNSPPALPAYQFLTASYGRKQSWRCRSSCPRSAATCLVLVLVAYAFLNLWMSLQVGKARRKYKVPYPTLYAVESENRDAKLFNCVQRGHQNSLEVMPLFFAMLLLGGLRHPAAGAGLGALYTVARFFYFTGYATGAPRNRMIGVLLSMLARAGLILCTASFGISLVVWETL